MTEREHRLRYQLAGLSAAEQPVRGAAGSENAAISRAVRVPALAARAAALPSSHPLAMHGARPGRRAGLSWAGPAVRWLPDAPAFDLVGDGLAQRACVRGIDADG